MGGRLWRGEAQEGIDGRAASAARSGRTRCGNEALEAAALRAPPPGGARRGNVRRAGAPRGVPTASEGNALKGEAQGRSGASAPGGPMVGAARGGETPDVARGGRGTCRQRSGSIGPACVVGRESPGEAAPRDGSRAGFGRRPCDGVVPGPGGTSLKGRESARGASPGFGRVVASEDESPQGVETPHGADGTHGRPSPRGRCPRSATKPHERPPRPRIPRHSATC